jgi:hypothetical protein
VAKFGCCCFGCFSVSLSVDVCFRLLFSFSFLLFLGGPVNVDCAFCGYLGLFALLALCGGVQLCLCSDF